jgi:pimeloyl-ACP methyl ester carboxylesterase
MIDVDVPRFAPYRGSYALEGDHVIFVGGLLGSTVLTLHDFQSRRIGVLAQSAEAEATFHAGPALWIEQPPEIWLTFERGSHGDVVAVCYRTATGTEIGGQRVPLAQEPVCFANGDVTLVGTLFLPRVPGPHPAVVLIHGSGPQTRACVQLHAEYFARHGVAALAYDKRGAGESSSGPDGFRLLARDALAGLRLLQQHPQIDGRRIGLCGSSQGGWIAPLAAVDAPDDVAFAILVAGPAVSIAEQNRQNVEYSMRAAGFAEEQVAVGVRQALVFNELVRTGEGWEEFRALVRRADAEGWAAYALAPKMTEPPPRPVGGPRRGMDADPTLVLERVKCPVLALFGDRDTVVPSVENAPLMEAALRKGGSPHHSVVVIPGANHLLHEADASSRSSDVSRFFPEYLEIMARWIRELPSRDTT